MEGEEGGGGTQWPSGQGGVWTDRIGNDGEERGSEARKGRWAACIPGLGEEKHQNV